VFKILLPHECGVLSGMNYLCLDGKILPADQPVFMADNRGYRYGDGLFETIKVVRKKIALEEYHFQRFFAGLKLLRFDIPSFLTAQKLQERIIHLCEKNKYDGHVRVRLSGFRGNGGLYEGNNTLHYLIECWPLDGNQWNENGLFIGIYPDARKSSDAFSNLKSANFLPYVMATRHAKENKWNDCLVLNEHGRIADATIANVFLIKNNTLVTPALTEACVDGVMRRYLLNENLKLNVEEKSVTIEDILNADEVFLTNAISGIRWVKQIQDKQYGHSETLKIYKQFIKTIWE
jgi:branched-chain amino acid aminotransferase